MGWVLTDGVGCIGMGCRGMGRVQKGPDGPWGEYRGMGRVQKGPDVPWGEYRGMGVGVGSWGAEYGY